MKNTLNPISRKTLALLLSCLLMALFAQAQQPITINAGDVTLALSLDTFRLRQINLPNNHPFPIRGANRIWDYSTSTGAFPGAKRTYFDSITNPTLLALGANHFRNYNSGVGPFTFVNSELYYRQDSTGIAQLAYLTQPVSFPLSPVPTDLFTIISQPVVYTQPSYTIRFPLVVGQTWSTNYSTLQPFTLSLSAAGLNNTPGSLRQYTIKEDSVIGWGTIIMPSGAQYEVLQTMTQVYTVDSIFLGGAPAPTALLTQFGLVQGSVSENSRLVRYWAKGQKGHVAEFGQNSSGGSYILFNVAADRVSSSAAPLARQVLTSLKAYPNPVKSGQSIHLQDYGQSTGLAVARLFDLTGKQVAQQVLLQGSRHGINIPSQLKPGTYMLQLQGAGQAQSTRLVVE